MKTMFDGSSKITPHFQEICQPLRRRLSAIMPVFQRFGLVIRTTIGAFILIGLVDLVGQVYQEIPSKLEYKTYREVFVVAEAVHQYIVVLNVTHE